MTPSENPSPTKQGRSKTRQSFGLKPKRDSMNTKEQQRCGKDRHGKVEGRDCRVRLPEVTHKRFLQLRSELGHRNNGQTIEWLLSQVPPSHFPGNNKLPTTTNSNLISSYSVSGSACVGSSSSSDSSVSLHALPLPSPPPPPPPPPPPSVATETMQITSHNHINALSVGVGVGVVEEEGIEYDMFQATRNMSFMSLLLMQCGKEAQPKEHSFL